MADIKNERRILFNLLDNEQEEKLIKIIFIDLLKKSHSLEERKECFSKLTYLKKHITDTKSFLKDIFLHDAGRIKIETERIDAEIIGVEKDEGKIGWFAEEILQILNDIPDRYEFIADLILVYLSKFRHYDSNHIKNELLKKNKLGLSKELHNSLEKIIGENNKSFPLGTKQKSQIRIEDYINNLLIPSTQSSKSDTAIFQTLSHDQLCESFKNYLQSSVKEAYEHFSTDIIHGLKDSGVDVLITIVNSGKKFGIQVKCYDDITQKDFAKITKSNVLESKQHKLEKYYIAICGDLASQDTKIRMITSEFSKADYHDYVRLISPMQCAYILQSYFL